MMKINNDIVYFQINFEKFFISRILIFVMIAEIVFRKCSYKHFICKSHNLEKNCWVVEHFTERQMNIYQRDYFFFLFKKDNIEF